MDNMTGVLLWTILGFIVFFIIAALYAKFIEWKRKN